MFAYDAAHDTWRITNQSRANMRFRHTDADPWEEWEPGKELLIHHGMRLEFGRGKQYNRALVNIVGLR